MTRLVIFSVLLAVLVFAADSSTTSALAAGPLAGQIIVDPNNPQWLTYSGGGPFFLAGPGDPEDFLYRGSRNPDGTRNGDQLDLINKLKGTGANSIYFQAIRSHGGDGGSTHNPFVDPSNSSSGINTAILDQWETWFTDMDNSGIVIYFFFYDDNINVSANLGWSLDGAGNLNPQEKNFIDTLVNRFEHHKNLIWVVMEEVGEMSPDNEYIAHAKEIAKTIRQADDHDHVIAVHKNHGLSFDEFADDPNIDQFALQWNGSSGTGANASDLHASMVTAWNNASGRYNLNMSESDSHGVGSTARKKNWASAMGGAYVMVLDMDIQNTALSDLQDLGRLRNFMESTNFNEMAPHDELSFGGTQYVLALPGDSYIAYASSLAGDIGLKGMTSGAYDFKWFDVTNGTTVVQTSVNVGAGDQTWSKPTGIGSELAAFISKVGGSAVTQVQIPSQSAWVDRGIIMTQGGSGSWDVALEGLQWTAVTHNGVHYLYYIGADGNRSFDGGPRHRALGVTSSTDGNTYTKHAGNPVITHLPSTDPSFKEEEGFFSAAAITDPFTGEFLVYGGVMTAFSTGGVNDDGKLYVSSDGVTFPSTGTLVLDHADPSLFVGPSSNDRGTGDEVDPLGAFFANGKWHMYYSSAAGWVLGMVSGPARDNLPESSSVPVITDGVAVVGAHPIQISPTQVALFVVRDDRRTGTITHGWVEVYVVDIGNPAQLGVPVLTYDFSTETPPTYPLAISLDCDTATWFLYSKDWGTFNVRLKTAPAVGCAPADTTDPSAPTALTATAVSDSRIDLQWAAASDPESGISSYRVYRDGVNVAQPTTTSFADSGLTEGTTYTYQVAAVNGAGLEGGKGAPASAATLGDTVAPTIVSVTASGDPTKAVAKFSEPVDQASATNAANYSIDNGIIVSSASLGADLTTVTLTTSDHAEGTTYTLTVNNVLDRASSPNAIAPNTQSSYSFFAVLVISNLSADSGAAYQVVENGLNPGATVYIDRFYAFTTVPNSLAGTSYIMTANDDTGSAVSAFLSFSVNQDVTVYVAYDIRATSLPNWLSGWTDTNQILGTEDVDRKLYAKVYPAGTVTLGGNKAGSAFGAQSNYNVILVASATGAPVNQSPVANFVASPTSGAAPLTVNFDATGSSDSDGAIVSYSWDFGDGAGGAGATAAHQYNAVGTYAVSLTVTDDAGASGASSATVTASGPYPTLPGMAGPARDLDGDGLAEDVNGNGAIDFADVVALFDHIDSPEVQNNQAYFDFDGSGQVGTGDVVRLFEILLS